MKTYFKYLLILFITVGITACSSDYLDVNEDPNNPTNVAPELKLPVALNYTARQQFLDRYTNTIGNLFMVNWSQSDGFSWYYDEFNYLMNANFYDQIFDYVYSLTLKQYKTLDGLGEGYENYEAIANIMMAHSFQILVDGYGDVPYFDALQRGNNPTPAYDDDQEIYADLLVKLDEAINLIKTASADSEVPSAESDIMFGGDMNSWIKFANTLKLRILLRQQSVVSPIAGINSILAEGSGFLTSDAMVNPGYLNEEGKQSPMYGAYGLTVAGETQNTGEATCASEYAINYLQSTFDARIDYIYEEPATGHLGVEQGLLNYPADNSLEPEFVSNLGPGILIDSSQDAPIMLAAESYFLQAEAALLVPAIGDPMTLYNNGIQASFDFLGAGDATTYYGLPFNNVSWASSSNKLEAIITQKWIALNSVNGYESWVEYNRTGYPVGLPVPLNNTHSDRPLRFAYPNSEVTGNTANIPSQPDPFTVGPFWK